MNLDCFFVLKLNLFKKQTNKKEAVFGIFVENNQASKQITM